VAGRVTGNDAWHDTNNPISIAFPIGSRIVGLPGNEVTVRSGRTVSGDASVAGGGGWRPWADEHALWKARILLGGVGRLTEEWERIQVTGPEFPADFEAGRGRSARRGARGLGGSLCEFVELEGRVFLQKSIDAALQNFGPLNLLERKIKEQKKAKNKSDYGAGVGGFAGDEVL